MSKDLTFDLSETEPVAIAPVSFDLADTEPVNTPEMSEYTPTWGDTLNSVLDTIGLNSPAQRRGRAGVELTARDMAARDNQSIDRVYEEMGGSRPMLNPEGRPPSQVSPEVASLLATEGSKIPQGFAKASLQAIRGGVVPAKDESLGDRWIADLSQDRKRKVDPNYDKISGLGESTGYSLATMGASALAGLGATALTGSPVAGYAAGMAASVGVAYRGQKNDFLRRARDKLNEERELNDQAPMTQDEWAKEAERIDWDATKYGLWEAGPESVGNMAFLRALRGLTPGKAMLASAPVEHGTETATALGQNQAEIGSGLAKEEMNIRDAFRSQFFQTMALSALMGGGAKAMDVASKMRAGRQAQTAPNDAANGTSSTTAKPQPTGPIGRAAERATTPGPGGESATRESVRQALMAELDGIDPTSEEFQAKRQEIVQKLDAFDAGNREPGTASPGEPTPAPIIDRFSIDRQLGTQVPVIDNSLIQDVLKGGLTQTPNATTPTQTQPQPAAPNAPGGATEVAIPVPSGTPPTSGVNQPKVKSNGQKRRRQEEVLDRSGGTVSAVPPPSQPVTGGELAGIGSSVSSEQAGTGPEAPAEPVGDSTTIGADPAQPITNGILTPEQESSVVDALKTSRVPAASYLRGRFSPGLYAKLVKTGADQRLMESAGLKVASEAPVPAETPPVTPPKPLTQEAQDLLATLDQPGNGASVPLTITRNLRKIAEANGITVTDEMKASGKPGAQAVVDALREKQAPAPVEPAPAATSTTSIAPGDRVTNGQGQGGNVVLRNNIQMVQPDTKPGEDRPKPVQGSAGWVKDVTGSESGAPATADTKNAFTMNRIGLDGMFAPLTFERGETVKVSGKRPFETGIIEGISRAKKQAKVNGVWTDFSHIYKDDYDEFALARKNLDADVARMSERLEAGNTIDFFRMLDNAKAFAGREGLAAEYDPKFIELKNRRHDIAVEDYKQQTKPQQLEPAPVSNKHRTVVRMTMEEWKKTNKNFKGKDDQGGRTILYGGVLHPVEIVKDQAQSSHGVAIDVDAETPPSAPTSPVAAKPSEPSPAPVAPTAPAEATTTETHTDQNTGDQEPVTAGETQAAVAGSAATNAEIRQYVKNRADELLKVVKAPGDGFVVFDVPGDGTFKIKEDPERIAWFVKQIEKATTKSSGNSRTVAPAQAGRPVTQFLKDLEATNNPQDYANAIDIRESRGMPTDGMADTLKAKQDAWDQRERDSLGRMIPIAGDRVIQMTGGQIGAEGWVEPGKGRGLVVRMDNSSGTMSTQTYPPGMLRVDGDEAPAWNRQEPGAAQEAEKTPEAAAPVAGQAGQAKAAGAADQEPAAPAQEKTIEDLQSQYAAQRTGHPQWATQHERDVSGKVVWSDEETKTALIEGYSIIHGRPVYAGIKDGQRTRVDIEGYTGKLFTEQEKSALLDARQHVADLDKRLSEQNPDGPFSPGDQFAFSQNVPEWARETGTYWAGLLGLKPRIYFTTVDDAKAATNLYGPYAAVRSVGVDEESGQARRLSNGDYYIALKKSPRTSGDIEMLAHELGHVLEKESLDGALESEKSAIIDAYKQWVEKAGDTNAREWVRQLRAHTQGKIINSSRLSADTKASQLPGYWRSFSEWFADQVSRWATTEEKPLSVVDQFFKRIADALRRLYTSVSGKDYLPHRAMRTYLNRLADGGLPYGAAPEAEQAAPSDTRPTASDPVPWSGAAGNKQPARNPTGSFSDGPGPNEGIPESFIRGLTGDNSQSFDDVSNDNYDSGNDVTTVEVLWTPPSRNLLSSISLVKELRIAGFENVTSQTIADDGVHGEVIRISIVPRTSKSYEPILRKADSVLSKFAPNANASFVVLTANFPTVTRDIAIYAGAKPPTQPQRVSLKDGYYDKGLFEREKGLGESDHRFSIAPTSRVQDGTQPAGLSVAQTQAIVDQARSGWLGKTAWRLPIRVAQTQDEALGAGSVARYGRVKGFIRNGEVWLIAENLESAKDARRVLAHEVVGHYGPDLLGDQARADFLRMIKDAARKNYTLRKLWDQEKARNPKLDEAGIAEEVFAKAIESGRSKLGQTWDRIMTWLRDTLRALGIIEAGHISPAELRLFAQDLARAIRAGAGEKSLPLGSRFALSPKRIAEMDKDYLAAVERGDMETAQKLVKEAAQAKGYGETDHRMQHAAPDRGDTNLLDIKTSGLVPDDYWTNPKIYQGMEEEMESWHKVNRALDLQSVREANRPPVRLTVYRAVPKGVKEERFRNGDWVTPSLAYAQNEGGMISGGYRIMTLNVPITQLWWDGNSIAELGFDDGQGYVYRNTKNNRKRLDPVTYDDNGQVIPLSKRFNLRVDDPRFMFAGKAAKTADTNALATAQARLAEADRLRGQVRNLDKVAVDRVNDGGRLPWRVSQDGRYLERFATEDDARAWVDAEHARMRDLVARIQANSAETVRKETGWFRGADGKWRFEIDDSKARLTDESKRIARIARRAGRYDTKVGELIDHPSLFSAYPELKDLPVEWNASPIKNPQGNYFYGPDRGIIIYAETINGLKTFLLHEIQHAIQENESFAAGGSLDNKNYNVLYGEVESRNTQARAGLTAAERQATPPSQTQDVPDSDVIVVWNGQEMASAPRPENAGNNESIVFRDAGEHVQVEGIDKLSAPGKAYRGMTEAEYLATVAKDGLVKSSNNYSMAGEGTSFSSKIGDAEDYVDYGRDDPRTTGVPNYLVEVDARTLEKKRDGYLHAVGAAPVAERVWKIEDRGGALVGTLVRGRPENAGTTSLPPTIEVDGIQRPTPTDELTAIASGKRSPITGNPEFSIVDSNGTTLGRIHTAETASEAVSTWNQRNTAAVPAHPALVMSPTQDQKPAKEARSNWTIVRGPIGYREQPDDYYYHVTSYANARRIIREGLTPGSASTMADGWYREYSRGKVFVTDRDGVAYWKEKISDHLESQYDHPPAIAVVRIPKSKAPALTVDEVGSRDAKANAWSSDIRFSLTTENEAIRTGNRKFWNKAKSLLRRQLAPGGNLPQSTFDQQIQKNNQDNVLEMDIKNLLKHFDANVKTAYQLPYWKLPDATKDLLDKAIRFEDTTFMDASIPEPVKLRVLAMRQYVDGLSTEFQTILFDEAEQLLREGKDEMAAQRLALLTTIASHMGEYIHRSYQVFDDPKWIDKVTRNEQVMADARRYLTERGEEKAQQYDEWADKAEAKGDTDLAERHRERAAYHRDPYVINKTIRLILTEGKAFETMGEFALGANLGNVKESKLGAMDMSVLMRKKEIALEIRALMGEYTDPRLNFARSATKMGRLIHNNRFLKEVLKSGEGVFLFKDPKTAPMDVTTQIATSKNYAPLAGYYTTPEIKQAFEDAMDKPIFNDVYRVWLAFNSLVKIGQTVASVSTQVHNFVSNLGQVLNSGHFNLSHGKTAFKAWKEYRTGMDDGKFFQYLRHLREIGVHYDSAYASEMMELIKDARGGAWLDQDNGSFLSNTWDFAQMAYRYGDDFWKIIGFENEKALQEKYYPHLSAEEIEARAAKRIRDTYQTYSMVGRAVQKLRRFPILASFPSFTSEVIRTSVNSVRLLGDEASDPKTRALAARRFVGMVMAHGMYYGIAAFAASLLGIGDDERKAAQKLAPRWQKNSTVLPLYRDSDGTLHQMDLSYIDFYGYFHKVFNAMWRGEDWEQKLTQAADELTKPFLDYDIAFGAFMEAYVKNQKQSGGPVYNPQDSVIQREMAKAGHVAYGVLPSPVKGLYRLWQAANDKLSPSGVPYSKLDESLAFVGFRQSPFNPRNVLYYKAGEFARNKADASRIFNRVAADLNPVSPDELAAARSRAKQAHDRLFKDLIDISSAAVKSGMPKGAVRQTLDKAGLSENDARAVVFGRIPPFLTTDSAFERIETKSKLIKAPVTMQQFRERRVWANKANAEERRAAASGANPSFP